MKALSALKILGGAGVVATIFAGSPTLAFTTYSVERTWYNYGDPDYVVGGTYRACDGTTTSWGVVGDYAVVDKEPCD